MAWKGAQGMQLMWKAGGTSKRDGQAGYTYVAALAILVTATMAAQVAFIPSGNVAKRALEAEIMFQGQAYRDAIGSYWAFDEPAFPSSLEHLVDDPRESSLRHLRRLYNPEQWTAVYNADGTIQGVVPNRDGVPLKQGNFEADLSELEAANSYADWVFVFVVPDTREQGD